MFNFERSYRKAALQLALDALQRIRDEQDLTPETIRGLADVGIREAQAWAAKADTEQAATEPPL